MILINCFKFSPPCSSISKIKIIYVNNMSGKSHVLHLADFIFFLIILTLSVRLEAKHEETAATL